RHGGTPRLVDPDESRELVGEEGAPVRFETKARDEGARAHFFTGCASAAWRERGDVGRRGGALSSRSQHIRIQQRDQGRTAKDEAFLLVERKGVSWFGRISQKVADGIVVLTPIQPP